MRIFGPRRGERYDGPVAFSNDYTLVPRPGFYAVKADGKTLLPRLRVVCVDDAPGDQYDGAHHFEVAGRKDPLARQGVRVELEAHAHGQANIEAGG